MSVNNELSLWNVDSFASLYSFIQNVFPYYVSEAKPEKPEVIMNYMKSILQALDDFAEGKGAKDFSFSFVLCEADEMLYTSISNDGESIVSVTEGGSIYTSGVGGDSFTNWTWTISDDGEEDGWLRLDMDKVGEMITLGAKLSFDLPEEYSYDTDEN